ncbi:MAG: nicotinate-nucleotide pyrophosphorylase [Dehalococcoidia bacterium]|nr:MAG: nicotinate-nucleotide pyrophosphorylase [Dehalococcoidia bacterium]
MRQSESLGIDVRDLIFESIRDRRYVAQICARSAGVLSGVTLLRDKGDDIGVTFLRLLSDGDLLEQGTVLAELTGTAKQIALSEDNLIGLVAKYSGVAAAAARAKALSGSIHVVCGAWKKMPVESKQMLRHAVETGGLPTRISDRNFVYLDKNYVRMLGGIRPTLEAVRSLEPRVKAIQIRGETAPIEEEAEEAVACSANILMIDTGNLDDVRRVSRRLRARALRDSVRLAFAGDLSIEQLGTLQSEDIDIVDIGRAVIDAPLLDMRLDVVGESESQAGNHQGD